MKKACALLSLTTAIYSATPGHAGVQNSYTTTPHNTPTDQTLQDYHGNNEPLDPAGLLRALKKENC